ncbi:MULTISPECIES: hypothetical protein [Pseudomonas]|uniref:Uncharacterized protein n=2 Tax=Pseudomonas chlororaphis group TaxID=136842 RepID=U6ZUW9_9PSED|nr:MULTISPECIES: hypothetical protein [Pseudomonas]AZC16663.1 hypothetical protein C4K40_1251 [Pseudomonas sp. CMR5c]AZC22928.1 hypothetical protein C4K39_1233 [Pseudomonas sessilinigenes]ERO61164.1 hypothetical protein P308_10545 [Pseudomonas piscis]MCU7649465.1 hypothetical protein [Pseudomonas piscis]MQA52579.1 hypothetical protein [Pseudomonas piscis]
MNDEELAAINRLIAALQAQADGQSALNGAIRLLAQSNQALVDLIKSREPDPNAPPYLDGSPTP